MAPDRSRMNGGTGKMGRGGGNAGKRNIHAPPINRAASTARLSMGGGPRSHAGASSAVISSPSTSSLQMEENFCLVRENPLNFGMAIKLAPDLLEEIKRVEGQCGTARIKFDPNANNPNGNVIHVGDKSFKFTWSREPGDLCDIYEERRSGEDGNGLLVESGGIWRKLNVERELDESTKNHVKRRSEEAERKLKSRKAIVLDHPNPSMKNQMKAVAASESNQWRNAKNRKEPPFKKPRSEPPSVGGLPTYKSASSTIHLSRGNLLSHSPLSSQQEQHPASPFGSSSLLSAHTVLPNIVPSQNVNRALGSDKEAHSQLSSVHEKSKHNQNTEAKPSNLRSLMISLLQEHQSKGMSLKALEKAIRDAMPYTARQIEPILKQVATFQAPGRYFLKPEVEIEKLNKPLSQSRSSPETSHRQESGHKKFDKLPAQDPSFAMRAAANKEEKDEFSVTPVHTIESIEKIDILSNSLEHLNEKKVSNNSEGLASSLSDSGSDSDSDTDSSDSDNDSVSHSRSKSRSPLGSRSRSSTDTGSDTSSSSKQASDEDVDIMTSDDDKEYVNKLQDPGPVSSESPINIGKYDAPVSDVVEIEKVSLEGHHTARRAADNLFHNKEGEEPVEQIKLSSMNHHERDEGQMWGERVRNAPDSEVDDGFKYVQPGAHQMSKGQPKRQFDDNYSDKRTQSRKRLRSKNSSHQVSGTLKTIFGDSPSNSSPDSPCESPDKGTANVITKQTTGDGASDPEVRTGFNQVIATCPMPDTQHLGQKSSEACESTNPSSGGKSHSKHDGVGRAVKYSQKNIQPCEAPRLQSAFNADVPTENGLTTERRPGQFPVAVGDKHTTMLGMVKVTDSHTSSWSGHSPKNNNTNKKNRSPLMIGQHNVLQREHSDLELGELRDPLLHETTGPKKQFERKSSFKHLEKNPTDSECGKLDFKKGTPSNKRTANLGKLSPQSQEVMVFSLPDGPSKRKAPEHYANDHIRIHSKSTRPLHQHYQPLGDQNEVETQPCKVPEINDKGRSGEGGGGLGSSMTAHGDTSGRASIDLIEQQQDPTQVVGSHITKDSKLQKPDMVYKSNGRRKEALMRGSNEGIPKRKEPLDEYGYSFTKYEKKEPELKGSIKDVSQYQDYVKEYQEKYEIYSSLNKILESYRSEFDKLGKELEANKGRNMKRYRDILEQMRLSFHQCGERHKRLKKIFLLLHEELMHLKQMIRDYAASYKKN